MMVRGILGSAGPHRYGVPSTMHATTRVDKIIVGLNSDKRVTDWYCRSEKGRRLWVLGIRGGYQRCWSTRQVEEFLKGWRQP